MLHLPLLSVLPHLQNGPPGIPASPGASRNLHTRRIEVRAEGNDTAVFRCICFHSLKDSLRILEHASTFIHRNVRVIDKRSSIPFSIFIVRHIPLVCLYIAKPEISQSIFFFSIVNPPFLRSKQAFICSGDIIILCLRKIKSALCFLPFHHADRLNAYASRLSRLRSV